MQQKQWLEWSLQVLNTCIKKEERSQVSDINFHLRKLKNKERNKTKINPTKTEGKETINISV